MTDLLSGRRPRARGHRHVPPHRRRALHDPVGGGARRHGRRHRPPLRAAGRGGPGPRAACDRSSRARATASSPPSAGPPTRCWRRSTRSGALQSEAWPTRSPLQVRMAIHTGETRLRDEGNYVGGADRADGEAAGHRPRRAGAGVVGDARPRGGRAARRRRARRPRHPPAQGPRSARARVAAGPSGARGGVPSAARRSTASRTTCPSPCPRSSAASTRSTPSSASCSTTGSSPSWVRAGPARPGWPSRWAPSSSRPSATACGGSTSSRCRTRRCSPSAISRAALLAEDRDDRLGGVARRLAATAGAAHPGQLRAPGRRVRRGGG